MTEQDGRRDGPVIWVVHRSIGLVGDTSVLVGGQALGSLGSMGIPGTVADAMVAGQAKTMRSVTGFVDSVTVTTLRGIGTGARVAGGATKGAVTGAARGAASGAKGALGR